MNRFAAATCHIRQWRSSTYPLSGLAALREDVMRSPSHLLLLACALTAAAASRCPCGEVVVRNSNDLRSALKAVQPGTTLKLMPGRYRGGIGLRALNGREGAPITICGFQGKEPPVFTGGNEAIHLSDCNHIVLRDIRVRGCPMNGINIDDGGTFDTPSRHVVLERLTIENTGPRGNHDALKLSGVDSFCVRDCLFRGWGGSAIDMVGCHKGVIEGCTFFGEDGFSQATGIQMKGGTREILVRRSFFRNAGSRAINLGGSTGLRFFRPRLCDYEAKDIVVAGNRFAGSEAPIAWVTASGGHVHHNTFVFPDKWVLRILQETADPRFKPCAGGVFENNLIVYNSKLRVFVNVGSGTRPDTFRFRGNAWFQTDGSARPSLPTAEQDGIYQIDPELENMGSANMRATSRNPRLVDVGADRYSADRYSGEEQPGSRRRSK